MYLLFIILINFSFENIHYKINNSSNIKEINDYFLLIKNYSHSIILFNQFLYIFYFNNYTTHLINSQIQILNNITNIKTNKEINIENFIIYAICTKNNFIEIYNSNENFSINNITYKELKLNIPNIKCEFDLDYKNNLFSISYSNINNSNILEKKIFYYKYDINNNILLSVNIKSFENEILFNFTDLINYIYNKCFYINNNSICLLYEKENYYLNIDSEFLSLNFSKKEFISYFDIHFLSNNMIIIKIIKTFNQINFFLLDLNSLNLIKIKTENFFKGTINSIDFIFTNETECYLIYDFNKLDTYNLVLIRLYVNLKENKISAINEYQIFNKNQIKKFFTNFYYIKNNFYLIKYFYLEHNLQIKDIYISNNKNIYEIIKEVESNLTNNIKNNIYNNNNNDNNNIIYNYTFLNKFNIKVEKINNNKNIILNNNCIKKYNIFYIMIININKLNNIINQIEYNLYDINFNKINIDNKNFDCSIEILYEINKNIFDFNYDNNYYVNLIKSINNNNNNIDILNPDNNIYCDICEQFYYNNSEYNIEKRRKNFYKNISICEENCFYDGLKKVNNIIYISCKCKIIKNEINVFYKEGKKINYNFCNNNNKINNNKLKCFYKIFEIKNINIWNIIIFILFLFNFFMIITNRKNFFKEKIIKYITNNNSKIKYYQINENEKNDNNHNHNHNQININNNKYKNFKNILILINPFFYLIDRIKIDIGIITLLFIIDLNIFINNIYINSILSELIFLLIIYYKKSNIILFLIIIFNFFNYIYINIYIILFKYTFISIVKQTIIVYLINILLISNIITLIIYIKKNKNFN